MTVDLGRDANGQRRRKFVNVKGTKSKAQQKAAGAALAVFLLLELVGLVLLPRLLGLLAPLLLGLCLLPQSRGGSEWCPAGA